MSQKHIQYLSAGIMVAVLFFACVKSSSNEDTSQTQQNNQQPNPPDTGIPSGNCTRFTEAAVIRVNGPSTTEVNTELTLNVDFGVINGCGGFGHFEISETDFNFTIALIAKYEGCVCTANAPVLKTTYKFKPTKAGVYYLKFKSGIREPITHKVIVGSVLGR